ncbi:MAG: hypothetical protein GZ087_14995 [Flavobacterium sp.]|nr:hypothetical protein [Flavobacterium sp.]
MKNFEVLFKNNQFIDKQSGKVLHLKPNATFAIQGDNDNFLLEDFLNQNKTPLNSELKKEKLQKKFTKFSLEKVSEAKAVFYFRIGLGKITEEDKEQEYLFQAIIEEDLYVKSKTGDKWNLCDCVCKATHLVEGNLGFPFEIVEGNSLSELFGNVVSTYFNMKRATSCNAFTTFYFAPQEEVPSLYWIKNQASFNLDVKRKAIRITKKLEQ